MGRSVPLLPAVLTLLLPFTMEATDGYFSLGYGTASKGLAGAGVAYPTGTLSPATNPAGLAFVTNEYDLGLSFFSPDREFTVTGAPSGYPGTFGLAPGTVRSDTRLFLVPSLGARWVLGKDDAFGVAIYGNGGMNTTYRSRVFGFDPTGVDLGQFFVALTWSHKFGENHAVGLSPIVGWQRFKAYGLAAFSPYSADAAKLTDNGYSTSFGIGARAGYQGNLAPWISVGASYQTKVAFGKLGDYAGLFAGQGTFDVPPTWTAGIALHPTASVTVAVDVQRIYFSQVKSVGNPLLPNLATARLGDDGGAGFGWRDSTFWKIGLEWKAIPSLTLRAGYATGTQPIPESEVLFNILAPGVIEQHATIGVGYELSKGNVLNLAVTRAFSKTVTGPNPLEAPGRQTISLTMDQWDVELGFAFGF
jgi:long-chain fatty acid transport protein